MKCVSKYVLLATLWPAAFVHAADAKGDRLTGIAIGAGVTAVGLLLVEHTIVPLFQQRALTDARTKFGAIAARYTQKKSVPEALEELVRWQAELSVDAAALAQLMPVFEKQDVATAQQAEALARQIEQQRSDVQREIGINQVRLQLKRVQERNVQPLVMPADSDALSHRQHTLDEDGALMSELSKSAQADSALAQTIAELIQKISQDKQAVAREVATRHQKTVRASVYARYKEELDLLGKNVLSDKELERIVVERFGRDRDTMLQNYLGTLESNIQNALNAGIAESEIEPIVNINRIATRALSIALAGEKENLATKQQKMRQEQLADQRAHLLFDEELKQKRIITTSVRELTEALQEARTGTEKERALFRENARQLEQAGVALKEQVGFIGALGIQQQSDLAAHRDSIAHLTGQTQSFFGQLLQRLQEMYASSQQSASQHDLSMAKMLECLGVLQKQNEATQQEHATMQQELGYIKETGHMVAERVGAVPPATNPCCNMNVPTAPSM